MRVEGEGNPSARVMLVGEGPGFHESQTGRPFVEYAPAGAELTRYLNGVHLPLRTDVWITNLVKEWEAGASTKKKDVTESDVARDEWELKLELGAIHPEIVVALGRHSARWLLNADVDMEACHGLLFQIEFCPGCGQRSGSLAKSMSSLKGAGYGKVVSAQAGGQSSGSTAATSLLIVSPTPISSAPSKKGSPSITTSASTSFASTPIIWTPAPKKKTPGAGTLVGPTANTVIPSTKSTATSGQTGKGVSVGPVSVSEPVNGECACGATPFSLFILPVYHPAAGLHQPELAARTAYGFSILSALLKQPWQQWKPWTPAPSGHYVGHTPEYPYNADHQAEQAIDTEGTPDKPWGLSLSVKPGEAAVARFSDWDPLLPILWPDHLPEVRWIFHNYLWDRKVLAAKHIEVDEDRFDDTMLMAYLLGVEPQSLKALALRHLGRVRKSFEETVGMWVEVLGKKGKPLKKKKLVLQSLDDVSVKDATDYAGADADDTLSVKPILWQRVQDLGLQTVYEIDRRVLPLYSRMEEVGLPIDLDYFKTLRQDLESELEVRTLALRDYLAVGPYKEAYANFNPGSADQVATLIFNRLHLPGWKKTPSGKRFTTNDKILQALADLDASGVVQVLIEWREVQKLLTTFVAPIEQYCKKVGKTGEWRLFFQILPTRVVSGRVAYKDPNVGAFPKYGRGQQIRRGFRAGEGRMLGSFDLNQIELRVLALDASSSFLQEAFLLNEDLHGLTAAKIFGGAAEDYKEGPRRVAAKAVNFSIPMGTTKFGLAEQMRRNHYPFPELAGQSFPDRKARMEAEAEVCDQWIKGVIELWGIEPYLSEMRAMARRFGYVSDRWGRKRFLPSVLSPNKQVREEALRQAQAFGPQAGARGYMKIIEARVWREVIKPLRREGYYMEGLLDLHDDLTCEFQEDLADYFLGVVGAIFNETFSEAIPISAKGSVGATWADL